MFLTKWKYFFTETPAMVAVEQVSKRSPKALSFELIRQTEIFIEEALYPQAFSLLLDVLSSGTISSTDVIIPQPQHLAIAATMLVHPHTTTRAKSDAEKDAPSIALRLLRLTNALVGPTDAKLHTAFAFTHFENSRHGTRRADSPFDEVMPDNHKKAWQMSYSGGRSVWNEAEDFWHTVGWAFNCSVLHPAQWKHWQIWLQFMCEVLEDDWEERVQAYTATQLKADLQTPSREASRSVEPPGQENGEPKKRGRRKKNIEKDDGLGLFRESLIYQYIGSNDTYGRDRRIMRAIFADGKPKSAEFRSVFEDEIKPPKSKKDSSNSKKRAGVDLSKGEYGDYLNDSDEDYTTSGKELSASTPAKGRTRASKRTRRGLRNAADLTADSETDTPDTDHDNGMSSSGGYNSLALRQRLLSLLSRVSKELPKDFMPKGDLNHLFAENIRDLPLPVFQHFVTSSNLPGLEPDDHLDLCEMLFLVMRESSAPDAKNDYLDALKLQKCFLPYMAASTSAANNAKISMLLEAMITLLGDAEMLTATPELKDAARAGIERRQSACRDDGTVESAYLRESSFRIQFMVDCILP